MDIQDFQAQWKELGKNDPMWVVLTDPTKLGGGWKPEDFFATGVAEIEGIWQQLSALNVRVQSGAALDFGCGLGRLTQALCPKFDRCVGVDISESMLAGARSFNQFPDKCQFILNSDPDLRQFGDRTFDFVLSLIALQHTPTRFQKRYVGDFLRILKPGGIAFFQVADCPPLRRMVSDHIVEFYRRCKSGGRPFIGMYALSEPIVREIAAAHGAEVVSVQPPVPNGEYWRAWTWCLRKKV